jgi:hypothetical protein
MKNNFSTKWICTCLLAILIWHIAVGESFCQQPKEKETDETFFNLGYISYSSAYVLSADKMFITFKIKNNASRPVSNIFAWIYRTRESKEGEASDFILVSNPNKGGILLKGGSHKPGEIAEWRFSLTRVKETVDPLEKYTLRVSPKSIYFGDNSLK